MPGGVLAVLFLTLAATPAAAQVPDLPDLNDRDDYLVVNLGVPPGQGYQWVKPGGQTRYDILVEDASADKTDNVDNPLFHSVDLSARIVDPPVKPNGWQVNMANSTILTEPGQVFESTLIVQTSFAAQENYVAIEVNATLYGPDGNVAYDTLIVRAQLEPFYTAIAIFDTPPVNDAKQFQLVNYEMRIINQATYPDWYTIHINATEGFEVRSPSRVYLDPLSERTVNVSILTPRGKFYEFGQIGLLEVTIRSESDPGFVYATGSTIFVQGAYVSGYQAPLLLFGLLAVGLVSQKSLTKGREVAARKGKPRPVRVAPRQAVLLAELKRRDRDAYKDRKAKLSAVYAARKKKYRAERRAEKRHERATRKEQRRAAAVLKKERKKERKLARKEERRLEKERRKERKAQAKIDRKQRKIDKKAAKKQARIDKKAAKKQAKVDKREAKAQAKREKKLHKEIKRKEKALKKKQRKSSGGGLSGLLKKRQKD